MLPVQTNRTDFIVEGAKRGSAQVRYRALISTYPPVKSQVQ